MFLTSVLYIIILKMSRYIAKKKELQQPPFLYVIIIKPTVMLSVEIYGDSFACFQSGFQIDDPLIIRTTETQ